MPFNTPHTSHAPYPYLKLWEMQLYNLLCAQVSLSVSLTTDLTTVKAFYLDTTKIKADKCFYFHHTWAFFWWHHESNLTLNTEIWLIELRRDKTNNVVVRPAQTQISLGIRQVRSASWLSAWRVAKGLSYLHADSEDSDQTGRMPRLIWVCTGRTTTLLVLSCRGSIYLLSQINIQYDSYKRHAI